MSNTPIDMVLYFRAPRLEALSAIALARKLLKHAPKKLDKKAAAALQGIFASATDLQTELKHRARTKPGSLKHIDTAFDSGWGALKDRIAAYLRVASKKAAADRALAEKLLAAYFPDGVAFVLLSYESEYIASDQLLERIAEDGALKDIERLAGATFLANVREQHAALGEALGLDATSGAEDRASTTGVADKVTALGQAIAEYTRRMAGAVDLDDDKSVKAFRNAMAPLDAYRARMAGGGGAGTDEDDIDPSMPIPAPVVEPTSDQ